jgi:hypothetical protein
LFLGACPQTPWVRFADYGQPEAFCEAEPPLLLLFLEKEDQLALNCHAPRPPWFRFAEGFGPGKRPIGHELSLGARPQTPWVRFADYGQSEVLCKAEQRFLLLFLEKEGNY